MTQTVTPRYEGVEDIAVWEEYFTREDQVWDDDKHVDHTEDHQEFVE